MPSSLPRRSTRGLSQHAPLRRFSFGAPPQLVIWTTNHNNEKLKLIVRYNSWNESGTLIIPTPGFFIIIFALNQLKSITLIVGVDYNPKKRKGSDGVHCSYGRWSSQQSVYSDPSIHGRDSDHTPIEIPPLPGTLVRDHNRIQRLRYFEDQCII